MEQWLEVIIGIGMIVLFAGGLLSVLRDLTAIYIDDDHSGFHFQLDENVEASSTKQFSGTTVSVDEGTRTRDVQLLEAQDVDPLDQGHTHLKQLNGSVFGHHDAQSG